MENDLTRYITNEVAKVGLTLQSVIYLPNLSELHNWRDEKNHIGNPSVITCTTIRDFVRICFAEIGLEVEFSGKDKNEKGVIIDIDEEKLGELGLKTDTFKFGQTLIRVNPGCIDDQYQKKFQDLSGHGLDVLVTDMIAQALIANRPS